MEEKADSSAEFDVDKYRHSHESKAEWGLRRQFLLAHHDDIPLDRLQCMASCFVNVECYGCSYPVPVMEQLKMLTESLKDTVEEHRDAARKKTEVKFVAAGSNGAGKPASSSEGIDSYQTVKGRQGTQNSQQGKPLAPISFVKSLDKYQTTDILPQRDHNVNFAVSGGCGSKSTDFASPTRHPMDNKFYTLKTHVESANTQRDNAIETLYMAVSKVKMVLSTEFHDIPPKGFCCNVFIDTVVVGTGTASSKKAAKHTAFDNAVSVLLSGPLHVVGDDKLKLQTSNNGREQSVMAGASQLQQAAPDNECAAATSRKRKSVPLTLSEFIIIQSVMRDPPTAASVLNQSVAFNKMSLAYDFRNLGMNGVQCQLFINDLPFADATAESQQVAKRLASEKALERLQESSWTINIKKHEDTDNLGITKEELLGEIEMKKAIPTSNIGNKLLMKMGWTGGGVGKEGNKGIAEPVSVSGVIRRSGLGFHSEQGIGSDFLPKIRQTLQDYVRSDSEDDIAFASDFSKEERAMIHVECRKLGLKSHSHGSGEERYLVVGRKRSAAQLFTHLMQSGGETSKYVLIPPGQAISSDAPGV